MRRILHVFLFLAVTFSYVLGSHAVFEFEHSHETVAGHAHGHSHEDGEHGDHPDTHGHDSIPLSEEPESGDHSDVPHPHSHVTSLGTDAPFIVPSLAPTRVVSWTCIGFLLPEPVIFPESPCFSLIKPPQLG